MEENSLNIRTAETQLLPTPCLRYGGGLCPHRCFQLFFFYCSGQIRWIYQPQHKHSTVSSKQIQQTHY